MVQFWKGLWSDESGQGLTEYALFIGMISVSLTLIAIGIAAGVLALALALGRGGSCRRHLPEPGTWLCAS